MVASGQRQLTKRPVFAFVHSSIRPGDALQVFIFQDDYSFGILQSHAHWLSQVRRGLLELCILSLVGQQPMYGYQIVKRLTEVPGLVITEGTIYPLLSRLKSQGHVTSTLSESPYGPARRR